MAGAFMCDNSQVSGRACTLVSLFLGTMMLIMTAQAAQYTVGGGQGWTLGVNYTEWAASYTYETGDTLLFQYPAQVHSVLQVSGQDYKTCNTSVSARLFYDNKGDTTFPLTAAGKYWFICGVGTHCLTGNMKFSINVAAATPTTSAAAASSPSAFLILLGALTLFTFFF